MPENELTAHDLRSGQPVRIRWHDNTILSLEPVSEAPKDLWIAPPLLDLQINGYAGIDFQQDRVSSEDLLQAVTKIQAAGCTRFLFTLISDHWPVMLRRLEHFRKLRSQSEYLRRAIAGWHIEGPFLSAEAGFCGAHDPTVMIDPKDEYIDELRKMTADDPVLLTIAPERLEAISAIAHAVSLGMKVSLGHTNAPRKRLIQALKAGATGFTHLGNGCPKQLDRHDNILWRLFETPGFTASLIPDGIHVSPPLFRLVHKLVGSASVYYVSDAMAAAGAPPGKYKLARLEVEVGDDQIVRLPGSANFAGSALEPIDGIFRAADMLNCSWRDIWPNFSEVPARFMDLEYGLKLGGSADFCLVAVAPPNQLESLQVYVSGRLVANS
jgi:N-acetylglucosamine-6-phosphate deacetylase